MNKIKENREPVKAGEFRIVESEKGFNLQRSYERIITKLEQKTSWFKKPKQITVKTLNWHSMDVSSTNKIFWHESYKDALSRMHTILDNEANFPVYYHQVKPVVKEVTLGSLREQSEFKFGGVQFKILYAEDRGESQTDYLIVCQILGAGKVVLITNTAIVEVE